MNYINNINVEEIKNIAKTAGEKILEFYNQKYDVSYKDGNESTPLTEADLASEKIINANLKKFNIPILSEEAADDLKRLDSEYVFIVDPLDGTSDFIKRTGEFSVMIGLAKEGKPIMGVAYEPLKKIFYIAEKDKGCFIEKDGKVARVQVNNNDDFSEWKILVSRNHLREEELIIFEKFNFKEKIAMGSVPIKIGKIVSGEAEIYINSSDKTGEWDTCVGQIMIEEAGGKITDMHGEKIVYNKKVPKNLNGFVITNGQRHEEIITELAKIKKGE